MKHIPPLMPFLMTMQYPYTLIQSNPQQLPLGISLTYLQVKWVPNLLVAKEKIKKTILGLMLKNHLLATLDQGKVKRKDASNDENLLEALKGGRFDTLLEFYQERSSILIESTKVVNIGTTDLYPTTSLSKLARQKYLELFKRRQIKRWSYANIPGLDPDLIMHHPNISPRAGINNGTQHGSGASILFLIPQGHTIPKVYKLIFPCTNNTTKYEALVTRIKMAIEWNITQLQVFGDSQLVINQINDAYQTKDKNLMPYKKMVDDVKKYFVKINF